MLKAILNKKRASVFALITSFLAVFFALIMLSAPAHAAPNTIKVGYMNEYGVTISKDGQEKYGYFYEYLMEIAEHTGWEYEFIPVDWTEGLDMLARGEIDLFGPLQKSAERELIYEYPQKEMGYEYGVIYISENNRDIFYNDPASFDNIRLGIEEDGFFNSAMETYCKENHIEVQYVKTSGSKFGDGLKQGKYDAFLFGSLMDAPGTAVTAKIATEPYYLAAVKGNTVLTNKIDEALTTIFDEDPYFAAKLDEKYFSNKSMNIASYTRAEAQFIKNNPTLRVVCDPDWAPIVYYNSKTKSYDGIAVNILKSICDNADIALTFKESDSYAQSCEMIKNDEADLLLGYTFDGDGNDLWQTNPIIEIPILLVGHGEINMSGKQHVAMPTLLSGTAKQLMYAYPNFSYVDYHGYANVINALYESKEDLAFINSYTFNELSKRDSSRTFTTISTGFSFPVSISVSKDVSHACVNVLNKAFDRLKPEDISAIVFSNTVNRTYDVPFTQVLTDNAFVITSVIAMLFGLFFAALYYTNKRARNALKKVAYTDSLTGLSTLAKFKIDAAALLKYARPGEYVLVTADIDHFKYINDSFGYSVGDETLIEVAKYLQKHASPSELLGRISADNFIYMGKATSYKQLSERFVSLADSAGHTHNAMPANYGISFSAGMYTIRDKDVDLSLMLDRANIARKSIKGGHTNSMAEYTDEMNEQMMWKREVTLSMESALVNREFEMYLQPKISFSSGSLVGAEALVRWNHPQKGLLCPNIFIPVFEKNGFVKKIDLYIFEEACRSIKSWRDSGFYTSPVIISVNFSRLHLYTANFVGLLVDITKKYDLDPSLIEIELTESIVFYNTEALIKTMHELKNAGFQISIDDFGSGYSSLNLLKDLPADVLKLDKAFLEGSYNTNAGQMIIRKIIEMAKSLNLVTVAEGVETDNQAAMLTEMGCDIAQGYYYAKPMTVQNFEKLLGK